MCLQRQPIVMGHCYFAFLLVVLSFHKLSNGLEGSGLYVVPDDDNRAFISFAVDEVTPFSADLICKYSPGLNEAQRNICRQYPTVMTILSEIPPLFYTECKEQFRHNRWNCSTTTPPIYGQTSTDLRRLSKETAFTYAMTSAAMVHAITTACSDGRLRNCSCDTRLQGQTTQQGWQWGGCSDDVEFGIMFTRSFLDARETENITNKTDKQLSQSLVNLHNNQVGRTIVSDNMQTKCRCHGASGSCSVRTCYRHLPTLRTVSSYMKGKYDQSIKVSLLQSKGISPELRSVGNSSEIAPTRSLVYMKNSINYCINTQDYTANRSCIPQDIKNKIEANELSAEDYPGYPLPACSDLCCNGQYITNTEVVEKSCYCHFVWCCRIECDVCEKTLTTYKCTS